MKLKIPAYLRFPSGFLVGVCLRNWLMGADERGPADFVFLKDFFESLGSAFRSCAGFFWEWGFLRSPDLFAGCMAGDWDFSLVGSGWKGSVFSSRDWSGAGACFLWSGSSFLVIPSRVLYLLKYCSNLSTDSVSSRIKCSIF